MEFATVLVEALEAMELAGKTVKKLKLKLFGRKAQKHVKQAATDIAGINTAAKATVGAGFSLSQQFLDVDGADFQTLHAELEGRRVVVFIDDLDRADSPPQTTET